MCAEVMDSGFPLYRKNLNEDEAFRSDPYVTCLRLKTYLGAPLRDSTGKVHGTLCILDRENRDFASLDVEMITIAALHTAGRIRAEQKEKTRRELE